MKANQNDDAATLSKVNGLEHGQTGYDLVYVQYKPLSSATGLHGFVQTLGDLCTDSAGLKRLRVI